MSRLILRYLYFRSPRARKTIRLGRIFGASDRILLCCLVRQGLREFPWELLLLAVLVYWILWIPR